MEERISQSKTVERLDELVRDYIGTGWARLQLGAAIEKIREEQGLKTDTAVYIYIQKTHRYGLSRLRHMKRAAEVAEIVDGKIDIYSVGPGSNRLIKSDLVARPLVSHLRKREDIEQNKDIVVEILTRAWKSAKKDGRIEPNERDVKTALDNSRIGSKSIKLPELVKELERACNILVMIHRSAKEKNAVFDKDELLAMERMIEGMKEMIKTQKETACSIKEDLENAEIRIAQIVSRFPAYSQWASPCTKTDGLNHGLDKLLELLPATERGMKHKVLVDGKVLTLNYENFTKLCEELKDQVKLNIDGEGIIMPGVSKHGINIEGHESDYNAYHDCQTLMYGGLALALSNVCLLSGIAVPELEIGSDYVALLEDSAWGLWQRDGEKCALFARAEEEEIEPENEGTTGLTAQPFPIRRRREARGCHETTRRLRQPAA